MAELKPCPFCGSKRINVYNCGGSETPCWIATCLECRVDTEGFWEEESAIKAWNKRVENSKPAFTEQQIIALKAVLYGCNTNKRIIGGKYLCGIGTKKEQLISFNDALHEVHKIIAEAGGYKEDGK